MTTPTVVGRVRVPAPARTAAGFGLLAAATIVPFASDREIFGVEFESAGCGPSTPWPAACSSDAIKPRKGGPDLITGDPFVVVDSFECFFRDDATTLATTRLTLGASAAVERALWTGIAGSHPNFADDAEVLGGGVAQTIDQALGLIQQQLGISSPAGGVVHVPRGMAACLSCCIAFRDGNIQRDMIGNAFAFGAGYFGAQTMGGLALPAGASGWMVGTGPVTVRRGTVNTLPPAVDVTHNLQTVISEQPYVVTVECGVWAVPVYGCGDLGSIVPQTLSAPEVPEFRFKQEARNQWVSAQP